LKSKVCGLCVTATVETVGGGGKYLVYIAVTVHSISWQLVTECLVKKVLGIRYTVQPVVVF